VKERYTRCFLYTYEKRYKNKDDKNWIKTVDECKVDENHCSRRSFWPFIGRQVSTNNS